MGFLVGLALGIAVGVALIVAFARSENSRSARRRQLVSATGPFLVMLA
jgi:NhaP-type Na+/H+ or K+/H+ antiporter